MNKGFLKSLLYYLIGFGIAGLTYLTVGYGYVHGPGLHHIIILLTFIGGFLWLIVAAIQYFTRSRTENLKGIIFTNLLMILGFILFVLYIISDVTGDTEFEEKANKISKKESGDTATIYHGGSIIYMKIKDSVVINFIDSTRINWNEVEFVEKE